MGNPEDKVCKGAASKTDIDTEAIDDLLEDK